MLVELLRPEDLVALVCETVNLRLDAGSLVSDDPALAALLIFHLPPQSLAEQVHEENAAGDPPPIRSRLAGGSRLAFEVPAGVAVPFSVAGLLDWSRLRLRLPAVSTWDGHGAPPEPSEPAADITALELPYRLLLAPDPGAGWAHAQEPIRHHGRVELWRTRLVHDDGSELSAQRPAAVRAVWSPDYRPPPQAAPGPETDGLPFPSSLSPRDRHSLVVLTSAWTGFQAGPPAAHEMFAPTPVQARRLVLSGLGASMDLDGAWDPDRLPYPARGRLLDEARLKQLQELVQAVADHGGQSEAVAEVARLSPAFGAALGLDHPDHAAGLLGARDAEAAAGLLTSTQLTPGQEPAAGPQYVPGQLSLSGWMHRNSFGRDQYVQVVNEGYLIPFGHRAAKVTVVERRVETPRGAPTAYLTKYEYILVREAERSWAAHSAVDQRAFPFAGAVRLTTTVTPHVGGRQADDGPGDEWRWVRDLGGAVLPFQAVGHDPSGRAVQFAAPMIWVRAGADAAAPLAAYRSADGGERRTCTVAARPMAFAAPTQPGGDDTTLTVTRLRFDVAGLAEDLLPALATADVHLPAAEQFLGTDAATQVQLYQDFKDKDFDGAAGVFLEVTGTLTLPFSADKAGGLATPDLSVTGIGRVAGPIAGKLTDAAIDRFDPASFFDATAKLFGTVKLSDLIPVGGTASVNAPKLKTSVVPEPPAVPTKVVTTFEWHPVLKEVAPVRFTGERHLDVSGRIEHALGGAQGDFAFSGSLEDFTIDVLGMLAVHVKRFAFAARAGVKPSVEVALQSPPVTFDGALAFVRSLQDLIPPGVFSGSGPQIDISPDGLSVGYAIGLPPLSIGLLALHDLRFSAGLKLPFTSGKPRISLAFADRAHPFMVTVECLGGGGFLALELDTDGVIGIEGSFEFGGEFAFDIGIASGGVHAFAGIYFKMAPKPEPSELTGFVDLGGEVRVLGIVSVSVTFHLELTYFPDTKSARGRATLVVSVHVAFVSKSVSLEVERSFGSGAGDPSFAQVLAASDWAEYADAFA